MTGHEAAAERAREALHTALGKLTGDDPRAYRLYADGLTAVDALAAALSDAQDALRKIAEMRPVEPLEHQEFLGGAYLPHGPVTGCALAALASADTETP